MKKSWILSLFLWVVAGSAAIYAQTTKPPVRKLQPGKQPTSTKLPPARPSATTPPKTNPGQVTGPSTTTPANTTPASTPSGRPQNPPPPSPRPGLVQPTSTTPITTKPKPQRKTVSRRRSPGYAYNEGDHLLNVGIGLGYSGYYSSALPIGASYEYGITSEISIGAQLDFASASYYSSYYYYNRYNYRYTATYFGVRGSYHLNRLLDLNSNKLDLYVGLGLGYRNYSNYYDYYSPVRLNGFVGGRLSFSDSFGGFVELGYTGLSYSKIGLSFKF